MASSSSEARIEFRISSKAKKRIERAAAAEGRTLSDFAKDALTQRADAVLANHATVQLSDRDRDVFLQMLDSDAPPNAALLAAARRQRKLIKR